MIGLLADRSATIRRRAARVLRSARDRSALGPQMTHALQDPDPVVRGLALEGLGPWAGAEDGRNILLAALVAEAEWIARLGAARALHATPETSTLSALAAALADPHYAVRYAARDALARAGQAAWEPLERWTAQAPMGLNPLEKIARCHAFFLRGAPRPPTPGSSTCPPQ